MAERLTDNEIKKGLECCSQGDLCAGFECPYVGAEDCLKSLTSDALALINHLKREIEVLGVQLDSANALIDFLEEQVGDTNG